MRVEWVVLVAVGAWPLTARSADCVGAGLAAFNDGRLAEARAAFEAASTRPECADDPILAFNHARTLELLGAEAETAEASCDADARYGSLLEMDLPTQLREAAEAGRARARRRCEARARPAPAAPPVATAAAPAPPRPRTERFPWAATTLGAGGALVATGAVFLWLGESNAQDAEAAHGRYQAAQTVEAAAAARRETEDARDDADRDRVLGWTLLAAGAAVAGLGVWLVADDAPSVVAAPGPGGASFAASWRF
jgi:hypothetical protein